MSVSRIYLNDSRERTVIVAAVSVVLVAVVALFSEVDKKVSAAIVGGADAGLSYADKARLYLADTIAAITI